MKVRIGNTITSSVQDAESRFQNSLLVQARNKVIYAGKPFAEAMMAGAQDALTLQASMMMDTILEVIEAGGEGIASTQLAGNIDTTGFNSGGTINWLALSQDYFIRKNGGMTLGRQRHRRQFLPTRISDGSNFFIYFGGLRNYFARSSSTIINNRLGGVRITLDNPNLPGGKSKSGFDAQYPRQDEDINTWLIDNFTVNIFPNVDASLLPGLASNRWTETLKTADFEYTVFNDTKTEDKLANRVDSFRPLVSPIVQFYILVRFPSVLRNYFKAYVGRANLRVGRI